MTSMLRRVASIVGNFLIQVGDGDVQCPSPGSPIVEEERHTTRPTAGTGFPGVGLHPVSEDQAPSVPAKSTPHQANTIPHTPAEPISRTPDPSPSAATTSSTQSPFSPRAGPIPRPRAPPPNPVPSSRARARPTSAYFSPPAPSLQNIHLALANAREVFNSANALGLGSTMQRIRVDKAMLILRKIESQASSEADMVSVREQLFTVQCRRLELCLCDQIAHQDISGILYHINDAITTRTQLCAHSSFRYSTDNAVQFQRVLSHLLNVTSYATPADRQLLLRGFEDRLFKVFSVKDPLLHIVHLEMSCTLMREIFHESVRQFEDGKWVRAMSLLSSKESALGVLVDLDNTCKVEWESLRLGNHGGYIVGDVGTLRDEFAMLLAMCKAAQLLHLGDMHFEEAVNGEPEEVLARALLAQDDYRAALSFVTGHDIELEGMTLYRLGRFHSNVSKLRPAAHALYLRAIYLASSLSPALPKGDWYKKCTDAVQAYRDELHAEEAKEWANKRKPILEKLKDELQKLKDAEDKGDVAFAKFIFETWPPKTEGPKDFPVKGAHNGLSRAQHLKIITRYHTDKNSTFGEGWLVMCEEISKALVGRYNLTKT